MGAVLTSAFTGLENAKDLPQAATLCGACSVVCPVKIPLPELLRTLRERQMQAGLRPWQERAGLRLWAWLMRHPRVYAQASRAGVRVLKWMGGRDGLIGRLPLGSGWTEARNGGRFMPAPAGRTFREMYRKR
jgi:L-lactate dehydrogenase complex protein LldF